MVNARLPKRFPHLKGSRGGVGLCTLFRFSLRTLTKSRILVRSESDLCYTATGIMSSAVSSYTWADCTPWLPELLFNGCWSPIKSFLGRLVGGFLRCYSYSPKSNNQSGIFSNSLLCQTTFFWPAWSLTRSTAKKRRVHNNKAESKSVVNTESTRPDPPCCSGWLCAW